MSSYDKRALWCILIIFLISSQLINADDTPAMPVKVAKAVKKDVPVILESSGHLEPLYAINIKSRIDGKLEKVLIKDGAIVKAGEPLFEIDTVPYQLAVNQAEATLKKEDANLSETSKLADISSKLFKKEIIAKEELDKVQASTQEAEASVDAAKAALEIAKQNLKYCRITAPIAGMLGRKLISEGNLISAYKDIIITLNDITKFKVISSLPSNEFRQLKKYHKKFPLKISIFNPEDNTITLDGTLNYVANEINKSTGMFEVQGIIENKGYNFWPGEFVSTVITLTVQNNAIVIPERAIVDGDNSKIVYVINNNIAKPRIVKTGWREENNIVILEGVKEGETVVVEGLFKLYPGAKVNIVSDKKQK